MHQDVICYLTCYDDDRYFLAIGPSFEAAPPSMKPAQQSSVAEFSDKILIVQGISSIINKLLTTNSTRCIPSHIPQNAIETDCSLLDAHKQLLQTSMFRDMSLSMTRPC